MPAAPAAADCPSPCRSQALFAAGFGAWILLVGGRYQVSLLEPDLALLQLLLLCALAVAGLWAVRVRAPAVVTAALLLSVWTVTCSLGSLWPRGSFEAAWHQMAAAGLCALGAALAERDGARVALLRGLTVAALLVGLLSLAQAVGTVATEARFVTEDGRLRVIGSLNHPNNLAGFIALMLPVAVGLAVGRRSVVAGLAAVVLFAALALTYSKGGQLAALVGLVTFVWLLPPGSSAAWLRTGGRRARLNAGGAAVLATAALAGAWFSPLGARLRLFIELWPTLREFRRWDTYATAVSIVGDRPLLGCGPGTFGIAFPQYKPIDGHHELYAHAHSWFLHQAAETGLPGLLLLLAALAVAQRALLRQLGGTDRAVAAGLAGGLAGFCAAGLLDHNVGVPAIAACFWFVLGLCAPGRERGDRALVAVALALMLLMLPLQLRWNRGNAAYLAALGQVQRGELAGAADGLERARALDPDQPAYDLARVDLALWRGHRQAAQEELQRLEAAESLDTWYRIRLAALQAGAGDPGAAAATLGRARAADPAEPQVALELGLLAGRADELARASILWPDTLAAYAGLAQLELAAGRTSDALDWLRRAERCETPRDRAPRFILRYGRVDPTVALKPELAGRWLPHRRLQHGVILPRLRMIELEAELLSRGPWPRE